MTDQAPPSPRIERITLQGVGPFDDATFAPLPPSGPGELVLFEGPNGSGKTTILEAIAVLIGAGAQWYFRVPGWAPSIDTFRMFARDLTRFETDHIFTAPPVRTLLSRFRADPRIEIDVCGRGTLRLLHDEHRVEWQGDSAVLGRLASLQNAAQNGAEADWAALAFRGAQPTADLSAAGPKRIDRPPLRGALSFADVFPASKELGQILVNLYFDQLQAWRAAEQAKGTPEEADLRRQAEARQASLDRLAGALSDVLQRRVTIAFPSARGRRRSASTASSSPSTSSAKASAARWPGSPISAPVWS
jgi:energy-coupling factor transporter ATP-binding protein EcfA2